MNEMKIGLIGGSGLGQVLAENEGVRHEVETPFGRPSDAIVETNWGGVPVLMLSRHGPGHLINPSQINNRANIFGLKQLGCTHILASGAVGSLREEMRPRDLVIPDQVIDKTYLRANTFFEKAAVHVEFSEPFCPVLRQILIDEGLGFRAQGSGNASASLSSAEPFRVHDRGCYVCMEGPAFSTRAESLMHRLWGGDLIGMTAMPEAKLAREAEISYALVALVTDYDCWKSKAPAAEASSPGVAHELLKEIIGNLEAASANAVNLMKRAVEVMGQRREELMQCPAQRALELAIWSDKSQIDAEEVQRLGLLWMKYL
jgi:5'-methylthioadenosine phosphorylase